MPRSFAFAGRRREPGDVGQVRPDRLRGQLLELAVAVGGELSEVTAIGADRVRGGVGIGQVGEEVVDVPGERMRAVEPAGGRRHALILKVAG
jgi:hypothetical protein